MVEPHGLPAVVPFVSSAEPAEACPPCLLRRSSHFWLRRLGVKAEAQLQQIHTLKRNLRRSGFTRCSLTGNHCQ